MKRPTKGIVLTLGVVVVVSLLAYGIYLYNLPHRNVAEASADEKLTATALIQYFLEKPAEAQQHFLKEDGNSLILEVTGQVIGSETDFNNHTILIFGDTSLPVQIYAYMEDSSFVSPKTGTMVTVKGAISAGAEIDELLGIYTPVRLAKGILITNK